MAHVDTHMQECIDRCQACQAVCLSTVAHCLQMGGKHAAPEHISMMLACAEICDTSARFMLLGSHHHTQTCGVCAEVCAACAADCERFDDAEMVACAEVCRRCAESCREMAALGARG